MIIPTTDRPVAVLRLAPLTSAPRSVMRTQDDYRPLPLSEFYHAFTQPGGPLDLALDLGGACFDLRLSARIETGRSWELPVALSHWLQQQGHELVAEAPDLVVWATGALDIDRAVIAQNYHIPTKTKRSAALLRAYLDEGAQLILLVPEEVSPLPDLPRSQIKRVAGLTDAIASLRSMATGIDREIEQKGPEDSRGPAGGPPPAQARLWKLSGAGLAAAAVLLLVAPDGWRASISARHDSSGISTNDRETAKEVGSEDNSETEADAELSKIPTASDPQPRDAAEAPSPHNDASAAAVLPDLIILRPPDGTSCLDLIFGDADPLRERHAVEDGSFGNSDLEELCALGLRLPESASEALDVRVPKALQAHILASERRDSFTLAPGGERLFSLTAALPEEVELRWRVETGNHEPLDIIHTMMAGPR